MSKELMDYASAYQALRKQRCNERDAIFLPLETLRDSTTDELHLSMSFSGTSGSDIYFTQRASIYRAVRVHLKWLVLPTTISKLLSKEEFSSCFGGLLETEEIDGEDFWVIRTGNHASMKALLREFEMNNEFRSKYHHAYFPDPA